MIEWAAGILEGEGCFSIHKVKERTQCAIHCEMTDEDTVRKLGDVLKVGRINYRAARPNRKPSWILSIQKQQDIFDTLIRVMPYLGERRLEKAKELFNHLEPIVCK